MDLMCSRCGESWEIYYVLHEEPEAFERKGGLIIRCPSCPANLKDVSADGRYRGIMAEIAADVLDDDVDAIASVSEDFWVVSEEIKLKCPYCGSDEFKREYAHKWASQKVVNLIRTVCCTATTPAAVDNIRDVIVSDSGYMKKYIYHCYVCNALITPLEDLI